jgi:hypothetical protein
MIMATQPELDPKKLEGLTSLEGSGLLSGVDQELQLLRDKILFVLEIFPFLTLSHIHISIGTATSRRLWAPILDQLLEEGKIKLTTLHAKTPLERNQTFKVYHLSSHEYEDTALIQAVASPTE